MDMNSKRRKGAWLLLIAIMSLLLAGCKTTRSASSVREGSATLVNSDVTTHVDEGGSTTTATAVTTYNTIVDDQVVETVERTFSDPDTTGKQYVLTEKKTTLKRKRNTTASTQASEQAQSLTTIAIEQVDRTQTKTDYKSARSQDIKTKTSTPGFITTGVLVLIAALIIVVVMVLKKYRIL